METPAESKIVVRSPDRECYSDCTFFARASGGRSGFPSPPLSELDDAIIGRVMRKTVPAAEVFSTDDISSVILDDLLHHG